MDTTQYKSSPEEESQRYSRRNILRSEYMYEQGFQSPGGTDFVNWLCQRVDIARGHHILEIGSGLGGTTFHLAETYDASILGLDVSEHMVALSNERRVARNLDTITFQEGDIASMQPPLSTFDLAWSQDCLLYVSERPKAWQHIYESLKPGGQMLVTDFCRGDGLLTEDFQEYMTNCGYYLEDISSYAQTLRNAQFVDVTAEDITDQFILTLKEGRERMIERKGEFLRDYSQSEFDYLVGRWDTKIRFCELGDFRWGLFVARK